MRQILCLLLVVLLAGCVKKQHDQLSQHKKQPHQAKQSTLPDGPPKHPKPLHYTFLKPKTEPMSRYGNPESYRVNGQNYEVMPSSSGYKTRGIASWYGTKFHKQRTSSGEKYDMYAMTAAHRTLPLPSYIRVKNLKNGRAAIVRVNDRGPFHSSRVVDLSYAAAKYLGLFPRGTAQVEIQALRPKNEKKDRVAHYYIQAGAFGSEKMASILLKKLRGLTRSPVFIEKYEKHFIVKVGPFSNKQMSALLKTKLDRQNVHGAFAVLQ